MGLSRDRASASPIARPSPCIEPALQQDNSLVRHSECLFLPLRTKPPKRLFAGVRRDKWRRDKFDRVLLCELNHRHDELIGLEADMRGKFITDFELVYDKKT